MTQRITIKHLQAKVNRVNRHLGFDHAAVSWNTVGAVRLDRAYGGVSVFRIVNIHGGVSDLTGYHGTMREASRFLDGMIATLEIL